MCIEDLQLTFRGAEVMKINDIETCEFLNNLFSFLISIWVFSNIDD